MLSRVGMSSQPGSWRPLPNTTHRSLFVRSSRGMLANSPPHVSLPTAFYRKISLLVKCFPI